MIGGWKTITGAILIGLSGILEGLKFAGVLDPTLVDAIASVVLTLGSALGIVGIGHKLEKTKQ